MHRIAALPRRNWRDLSDESVQLLTEALRTCGGKQTLRPLQGVSLRELIELGGVFVMGRVGVGKTLIALLAGEVLREERVLILVPQGHKGKTEDEFAEYREDWNGVSDINYKLFGYGDISAFPKQGLSIQDLWGGLGPTLIVCDEADKLRRVDANKGASGLALQISDYLTENPHCKLVALTATPDKSSIKDYWHVLAWCLGEASPLPITPDDIEDWALVIDKGDMRTARKVCNQLGIAPTDDLDEIRAAYQQRLRQTPGVIISDDQFNGPLSYEIVLVEPVGMDPHFVKLRKKWQRPDGWDLSPDQPGEDEERRPDRITNGSIWGTERQLALGFCYVADPVPPEDWMTARRRYFQMVRTLLRKREYYTEMQVKQAAAAGLLRDAHQKIWEEWCTIKPTFEPGSKALWLEDFALEFCEEWGQEPGIIWVDHIAFGVELAKRTGWSYFGPSGMDHRKRKIDRLYDYKKREAAREPVIASRAANMTGRNLQPWNRHLITAMPANNRDFEQMVGRSHRELQWRPMTVTVMCGCLAHVDSIAKVLDDAERQHQTLMKQKATTFEWRYPDSLPKGPAYNAD